MTSGTDELDCSGCSQCCQWGDSVSLRPMLNETERKLYKHEVLNGYARIATKINGDCVYLTTFGCSIHGSRPSACRAFDCRQAYKDAMALPSATFIKVLVKGGMKS